MMANRNMLNWPEFGLSFTPEQRGLKIEQNGGAYLAKGWELTDGLLAVFAVAFEHGLTCLLQHGHPSETKRYETGASLDYISFSSGPDRHWVFALDMDSCPGQRGRALPTRVKFKKVYRHLLRAVGVKCPPEWRTPQNLHVELTDLLRSLEAVRPHINELGRIRGRRLGRGTFPFFVDEEDLHSFIITNWNRIDLVNSLELIGSKFLLSGIAHRDGEIDLLARDSQGNIFVIELKDVAKGRGMETPVQQLHRYMEHREILGLAAQDQGNVFGILIAQDLVHDVCVEVRGSEHPIWAYEATKAGDALALELLAHSNYIDRRIDSLNI